jgi:hypothetical protein
VAQKRRKKGRRTPIEDLLREEEAAANQSIQETIFEAVRLAIARGTVHLGVVAFISPEQQERLLDVDRKRKKAIDEN